MAGYFSGKIELSGFREVDALAIRDLKSIAEKYATRFSEICHAFEKLTLRMKRVHGQVHSEKYEVHASTIGKGKAYTSTVTSKNLLEAVDAALEKIEHEIERSEKSH